MENAFITLTKQNEEQTQVNMTSKLTMCWLNPNLTYLAHLTYLERKYKNETKIVPDYKELTVSIVRNGTIFEQVMWTIALESIHLVFTLDYL